MNIFAKNIDIKKVLSVDVLSTRATARTLISHVKDQRRKKIKLDFDKIEFASRSFMDELNSRINELSNKEIVKINMSDEVCKMNNLVENQDRSVVYEVRKSDKSDSDLVAI